MRTPRFRLQAQYVAVLVALVDGAFGRAAEPKPTATQQSGQTKPGGRVIELDRQTLNFAPTRDDLTVGCVVLAVLSSHPVRLNGVKAKPWNYLYLKQRGKNQFELPALAIEFAPDGPETIGCVSLKVWFNEVTHQADSDLYENRDDRYSLLSWCTNPPESMKDTSFRRNAHNRVQTPGEFRERLTQPLPLRMKQTPLRPAWHYPATTGSGRVLSEAELNAVKQIMQERKEQHLISIVGGDATHADVEAGIGDMTRYHGVRHYRLALKQGVWEVEKIVEEPNAARSVLR